MGSGSGISFSSSAITSNTTRNLNNALNDKSKSMEKLASGLRINKASDDAAGLAIATQLAASIDSLGQASRNVSDFSSAVQIADSAIGQIQEYTSKLAELATQAANGTVTDRSAITATYEQYTQEIQRIIDTTEFNGNKLLQGTDLSAQIGTGSGSDSQLTVSIGDLSSLASTLSSQDLSTASGAQSALDAIGTISQSFSSRRGDLGAFQSRLDSVSNSVSSQRLNETAAHSRIVDEDIADSVARSTSASIRAQASLAVLAQAGQLDRERVKSLLG